MKSLREFLQRFFQNKGQHVFFSLLIAKICAFAGSILIIRILPENEFGTLSIVASLFAIFLPFSGFGSHQSLLRFGSLSDDGAEKKALGNYLFLKGLSYQFLLSGVFLIFSVFYLQKYEDILLIFSCFAVRLIGFYFYNFIQSELRIFGNNKEFARVNNVVNIGGIILLVGLAYYFGLLGYLIAIAIAPFISLFWLKKDYLKKLTESFSFNKKEIWNYGCHASGTAILSDLLFSADVLLLSFLLNENAVANYKVAILIPANITFLALTFMQSDFPVIAKNYKSGTFLRSYIVNYHKIFIPVVAIIFLGGFIFSSEILHFFFSARYQNNSGIFVILLAAFCLNMLFRNLYGNLLSAVGKMKINTVISSITLILLIGLSFLFVPKFGMIGMGYSVFISLAINGILLMFSFRNYLKSLK